MESLVSLSWCIRQGTRGEGDGDADYLPPNDVNVMNHDDIMKGVNSALIFVADCSFIAES